VKTFSEATQSALIRVSADPRFAEFLRQERDDATKVLVEGVDPQMLYRAQGKVRFLNDLLSLLDRARDLR